MWRTLLLTCIIFLGLSGCACHYYREVNHQVTFYLKHDTASEAHLACSLDGFQPRRATLASGRWEVTVPADRTFRYFYLVDGEPFTPACRLKENDDFGAQNCIFEPGM